MGLVVGFFICYGSRNVESSLSWRLPFALLAAFSFVFAGTSLVWLPESPRWLTLCGRKEEALRAWDLLGVSGADREKVEDELEMTNITKDANTGPSEQIDNSTSQHREVEKKKMGWLDAFAPDVRARTVLAMFVLGMQQLSGIDGILYVS